MAKPIDVRPLVSEDVELGLETLASDNVENPPDYFEVVGGCSDALEMTSIPWNDAPPSYGSLYPRTEDDLVEMQINGESFLVRGRVGLSPWNVTPEAAVTPERIIRRDPSVYSTLGVPEAPSPMGASGGVVWRALKVNGKPVTVSGRALAVQGDLSRDKDQGAFQKHLNLRALKFSPMGKIFCVEFQRYPILSTDVYMLFLYGGYTRTCLRAHCFICWMSASNSGPRISGNSVTHCCVEQPKPVGHELICCAPGLCASVVEYNPRKNYTLCQIYLRNLTHPMCLYVWFLKDTRCC